MKSFLKSELSGWKASELLWMVFVCLVIGGLSIYWGDSVWGIISGVTGVLYTLLTGKGKLSAYGFGLVNCVLYASISFGAKLYGETILNGLYVTESKLKCKCKCCVVVFMLMLLSVEEP